MSRSTSIRRRLVTVVVGAALSLSAGLATASDATAAKQPPSQEAPTKPAPLAPLSSRGVARW